MSKALTTAPTPSPLPDRVFYVNEKEGDEFTFYLDRGKGNQVIDELRNRLGRPVKVDSVSGKNAETFSLPQRILVKNLTLTKDSLKLSNRFWTDIRKAAKDTPRGYLCEKL